MRVNKNIIIQFFRYLWIAIALALVLFILFQAFYTKRYLEYNLNFSEAISKDIRGWYPEQRINSISMSDMFDVVAEPIYMKIYTPINFDKMTVQGGILPYKEEGIRLGLKQEDGSWDFKQLEIIDNYFLISFDLENAQIRNNQLEIILSIVNMTSPSRVGLVNNWQVILSR